MANRKKKLLIISVAAMGWDLAKQYGRSNVPWHFKPLEAVFPALTCVAQASFRTASPPSRHGVLSNGFYSRELRKVLFWEQSSALVEGKRIWSDFRRQGRRAGMLFWQQSLGEDLDLVLSPRPVHKHSGGMIQDCLDRPDGLYRDLVKRMGAAFNLMHYWGPLASAKASEWIANATCETMRNSSWAPDVLFTYLPHLDYDLQRYGPRGAHAQTAWSKLEACLDRLIQTAAANDYEYLVFGDYAMGAVTAPPVMPNRILREAGLLKVHQVRRMTYPDFFHSEAMAMADHEVALVFARDQTAARRASEALRGVEGIESVWDSEQMNRLNLGHARRPDLLLVARPGSWFAYPWWSHSREAPDYATHIDIHNKPGYDPGELFFGWPPMSISTNLSRIRGTHGLVGRDRMAAWAASFPLAEDPRDLIQLAQATQLWLENAVN